MGRRRRGYSKEPWTKAFTSPETDAVHKGLHTLYKRALYHLVKPKFPLPHLPAIAHSLADENIWDTLAQAQIIMTEPSNSYSFFGFHEMAPVRELSGSCLLDFKSKKFLPNSDYWHVERMPAVLDEYGLAARACRQQWIDVRDTFSKLNESTKRATAGYYWPCASALMALGGVVCHDLASIQRPGQIPAEMTAPLRDTSAFVMQHSFLPAIDKANTDAYEGDEDTGIAAQLTLTVDDDETFSRIIWPITAS